MRVHAEPQPTPTATSGNLRRLADLYDEAKNRRVALGEQLRAENRDSLDTSLDDEYATATTDERKLELSLTSAVHTHPAWPWLSAIRGVTPVAAACLLARLDVHRAPTPSSFWAYCGLSTVPAVRYVCPKCGLDLAIPEGFAVQREHRERDTGAQCSGELATDTGTPVRAAPRNPRDGNSARFDATARKFCYLIGMSLIRGAGEYKHYYDEQRTAIAQSHLGWNRARIHMSALRKTEKLFLKNLWIAWRTAESLPIVPAFRPRDTELAAETS